MANTYTALNTGSSTSQTKAFWMDPSIQLNASDSITITTQNSVRCGIMMIAFSNVATGAPVSNPTQHTGISTTANASNLTSTGNGQLLFYHMTTPTASPSMSNPLDKVGGDTMTHVSGSPLSGQSITGAATWVVLGTASGTYACQVSQASGAFAALNANFASSGGTIAKIASSDTSVATTSSASTSFSISVPTTIASTSGNKVLVVCTFDSNSGTTTVADNATGNPVNTVAPVISGTQRVGSVLTTTNGSWNGSYTYTYQWKRGGSNISGATNSTYTLTDADQGAAIAIKCTVTANATTAADSNTLTGIAGNYTFPNTNSGIIQFCANDITGAIYNSNTSAPANTVLPVASGTARTGQTVSVTDGTWTGNPTPTFTYAWISQGGVTVGNSASYALTDADIGFQVHCDVTGTNGLGSTTVSSNALGPVATTQSSVAAALQMAPTSAADAMQLAAMV